MASVVGKSSTAFQSQPSDANSANYFRLPAQVSLQSYASWEPLIGRKDAEMANEPVFALIQRIRAEVTRMIDSPLSYDILKSPKVNFSIVRPLTQKLVRGHRPSGALPYALLVNRVQFHTEAGEDLASAGVNTTRGDLCELLAIKSLSSYRTAPESLELLHVLTANFSPFAGIEANMLADGAQDLDALRRWGHEQQANALELAVYSKAKRFVRCPLVQQVAKAIYEGDVTYRPTSGPHALITDDYKAHPVVEVYDWQRQPFLDHYRLRVPAIRSKLEFCSFAILVALFMLTEATREPLWELLFCLWAAGFALDELASIRENGVSAYWQAIYNVFDTVFCFVFFAYFAIRVGGIVTAREDLNSLAFDVLALAGCILFPRLSISLLRGNIVLLALSAMVKEFAVFMCFATLTASGFLVALRMLAKTSALHWSSGRISWLLFKIWLGGVWLGLDAAQEVKRLSRYGQILMRTLQFHPLFGPFLIVLFAILSQTLLLTILISLLSNTFANVQANAETEILYQAALRTIERAKSDALTSYMPPVNLLAFSLLFLLRPVLSPRQFHSVNVFLIRFFNCVPLLFIALYTRWRHLGYGRTAAAISLKTQRVFASLPRSIAWEGTVDGLGKVFEREVNPAALIVPAIDEEEEEETSVESVSGPPTRAAQDVFTRLKTGVTKSLVAHALREPVRTASLDSPLARMFSIPDLTMIATPPVTPQKGRQSNTQPVEKSVAERLAAIEEALAILVGEVTKSSSSTQPKEKARTLTGETEVETKDTD